MYQQLAYSVSEASKMSGIGRTNLYEAIKDGDLKIRKRGHRTIIRHEDLKAFIDALPAPQQAA